jgi:hypothetical protein
MSHYLQHDKVKELDYEKLKAAFSNGGVDPLPTSLYAEEDLREVLGFGCYWLRSPGVDEDVEENW